MSDLNYCSVLSRNSAEPLAGSAPFARHFVFITWPKKYWQYEALEAKGGFPQGLKKWMKEQSEVNGKISIRLVSRAGLSQDKVEIYIYPEKYCYSNVLPSQIPAVLESYFRDGITAAFSPAPIEGEQIFICTHGRHDKCCAKFGQELADKMRYHVSRQKTAVEVWDSSHLGGHRFAATMIDFPTGRAYGHLSADELPNYLASRKAAQVYGRAYRGSVFLSGLEQVAEAHVQHFCFSQEWRCQPQIRKVEKISDSKFRCLAVLHAAESSVDSQKNIPDELVFNFKLTGFESPSGCDALEEPQLRSCWVLESSESV
jgi:hypothetical protein